MRILNVSQNHYVAGGSDRYFFALADLLGDYGHEVAPFCASSKSDLPGPWNRMFPPAADFEKPSALDIVRFLYSRPARRQMRSMLDSFRPDLAHLHIYYGKLTASILAPLKKAGVPIVQTLHEYKQVCPVYTLVSGGRLCEACAGKHFWQCVRHRCNRGSLLRSGLSAAEAALSRRLGAMADIDHFIAVSHFQRAKMIALGLPEGRISTVHNFVDSSLYCPATTAGEYVLYYGRLERLKGVITLLDAAAGLACPLLIAGTGNAEAQMRDMIRERGLSHVRMLGFQSGEALQQLIRGSICTVLPSEWYEPFGLTVIESFASGCPVVGSRMGGISELIDDGRDGLLFDAGDAEALRDCLDWFVRHPSEAVRMGEAGRDKAESRFSPQHHYEQIMAIYDGLMRGRE